MVQPRRACSVTQTTQGEPHLLDMSQQHMMRGYSPTEFRLRMTRDDIGSYLGLQLETVSRVLSKFRKAGIIEVNQKRVRIADRERLRAVISTP